MRKAQAMGAMRNKGAVVVALALLGGCVSLGGKVPPTLFTLTAQQSAPAGNMAGGSPAQAIMVMQPETDQRLAVLRVPVRIDDAQVAYLQDAQWVDRPARLLRSLIAETLRAKGGRLVLEDDQAAKLVGTRLSGRLLDMGYDARAMAVVVRIDAVRTDAKGIIATRRFEAEVPGVSAKPEQVGPALNKAANQVAMEIAEWVGG